MTPKVDDFPKLLAEAVQAGQEAKTATSVRNACIGQLVENGVPVAEVAKALGHSGTKVRNIS